jgi:uncharacterized protein YkuJ
MREQLALNEKKKEDGAVIERERERERERVCVCGVKYTSAFGIIIFV